MGFKLEITGLHDLAQFVAMIRGESLECVDPAEIEEMTARLRTSTDGLGNAVQNDRVSQTTKP